MSRASTRSRRAAAAPSRSRRACCPTGSGCSRRARGHAAALRRGTRAVMSAGCRDASSCASAFANVHTCFCTGPRTIGTYTCSPFEPVVFTSDGIFSVSSASCTTQRRLDAPCRTSRRRPDPDRSAGSRAGRCRRTRVPLIQVDAAEIDHPQQRRAIVDHRESR